MSHRIGNSTRYSIGGETKYFKVSMKLQRSICANKDESMQTKYALCWMSDHQKREKCFVTGA